MVRLIERVAVALELPLLDDAGRNHYGGHSLRVTGAQHLAAKGSPLLLIQLIARWSSDVILRYVRDAPLVSVTMEYRRRQEGLELERLFEASSSELALIKGRLSELDSRVLALLDGERALRAQVAEAQHSRGPLSSTLLTQQLDLAILNPGAASRRGSWHLAPAWQDHSSPPTTWRAKCGWPYGLVHHLRSAAPHGRGPWCRRCFTQEQRALRPGGSEGEVEGGVKTDSDEATTSSE